MTPGTLPVNNLLISEAAPVTEFKALKGSLALKKKVRPYPPLPPYVHKKYEVKYKWRNIILYTYMHVVMVYAIYLHLFTAKWATCAFLWGYGVLGGMGISAGSHRLFAHKSYKAKAPLRLILAMCHAIANQNSMLKWTRDHRCHHKFSETDADPHNAKRGYFFSHVGWLMVNKHPDVLERGKTIDMSDIKSDPILMFQTRYFHILGPLFCFVIPTLIPWYFWGEDFMYSWYLAGCMKFVLISNFTWLINSAGHLDGMRPYDRNQGGTDNMAMKYSALGESWHNYHHTFPWDYASCELGINQFNLTTAFIDMFSILGWSYDKKVVPLGLVKKRVLRTGDGSHRFNKEAADENHFWGWGDKDMTGDEKDYAEIIQ